MSTAYTPFHEIRRVREDGSEYWSARELMPRLGYTWNPFEALIEHAERVSDECVGVRLRHFVDAPRHDSTAPEDTELSRFAVHLVVSFATRSTAAVESAKVQAALAAAGQLHGPVRTRSAERAIPGHLYVIENASGRIKVGRTSTPGARMSTHQRDGKAYGDPVQRHFVSERFLDSVTAERDALDRCGVIGRRVRGTQERFEELTFEEAVEVVREIWLSTSDADEQAAKQVSVSGYITRGQAEKLLGVSRPTVTRMLTDGRLRSVIVGGRLVTTPEWIAEAKAGGVDQRRPVPDGYLLTTEASATAGVPLHMVIAAITGGELPAYRGQNGRGTVYGVAPEDVKRWAAGWVPGRAA